MGLYNAAGTRITRAGFPSAAAPITDPEVVVTADVYYTRHSDEGSYYNGASTDKAPQGSIKAIAFRAGQVVRQSKIDRFFQPATVDTVSPAGGPVAGGTVVTITGQYLDGVTDVKFNGVSGTALTVVSATKLTVTSPAGSAGIRDVVLVDDAGNVTKTGAFTYS